ncbi:protein-glutamine gamma-glutamyltransferase 5-like [Chaetodon trifascialis]|uniref:protein-glutamine gamma-glutamyltransferase 5-like n=1 Tax=Chaetodon trifascialis TaxID=109706 RepID=UPI003994D583
MTVERKESIYGEVDLQCKINNTEHHTSEISVDELIVRRGQPFNLSLKLTQAFNPQQHPLHIVAETGNHPSEDLGTMSCISVPDDGKRSPSAKAVWKLELQSSSSLQMGLLNLTFTPPADAPVGQYILRAKHRDEEMTVADLVVLFNPWCPDDWVYLADEDEKQEYVMNEQGKIFKGSGNYISSMSWDFGQFEFNMVDICMKMLDLNHKHKDDPADDVSARCNPIYVSRVICAMINCEDDHGVLEGRWQIPYWGGRAPSHWSGSHEILKQWYRKDCQPVKYGQCWVLAGVMCSVMRLLGVPCRVVTNFMSAHDTDRNLIIDVYHADYGVREKPSHDSIWNFHVWVECWMRRPDLAEDGKYDGWQVLDPTPQEKSDGIYCCGPAPVKAIRDGQTDLKYDIPFVFAGVNADCIDWLVKADGSMVKIWSDIEKVGQNISTKSINSRRRLDITDTYKHKEGSDKERSVFKYACTRDYSNDDEEEEAEDDVDEEEMEETMESGEVEVTVEIEEIEETEENEELEETGENEEMEETVESGETNGGVHETTESTDEVTPENIPPPPEVSIRFEEVTKPVNGKDVSLKLVLHSRSSVARPLSVNISVQAMNYNGSPAANIQSHVKEETLQPEKDLSIPILVPYSAYKEHMLDCEIMKVEAIITDKQKPDNIYLAEDDVILQDPPISVTVFGTVRLNCKSNGEVVFKNPVNETLKNCTVTCSGSGLFRDDMEYQVPDIKPNNQARVKFSFFPYKAGKKTLMIDFDCSTFRDIKRSCTVNVKPSVYSVT